MMSSNASSESPRPSKVATPCSGEGFRLNGKAHSTDERRMRPAQGTPNTPHVPNKKRLLTPKLEIKFFSDKSPWITMPITCK
jgi:hypothetical protein